MRTTQQLSITLPLEMAQLIKEKVSHGGYASESEVIREGLRALQERDAAVERWLREDVVPTYRAHKANPKAASPLADVAKRMDAFMNSAGRKKAR
jgi:antitoxin ParD1/3/4